MNKKAQISHISVGLLLIILAGVVAYSFTSNNGLNNLFPANNIIDHSIYPDPNLTPGDILTTNASVVCVSGYTATVRDVSVETKRLVYSEYGETYPQSVEGTFEVDHFVPLCAGGSNDIKNLWLEPANPKPGFHEKDIIENCACRLICQGKIDINDAQQRIINDWYSWYLEIKNGCN